MPHEWVVSIVGKHPCVVSALTSISDRQADKRQPEGSAKILQESAQKPSLQLKGLQIRLRPELRAMYPVVVNVGISGDVEINGEADPQKMQIKGEVRLESGEVNFLSQSFPCSMVSETTERAD